jgi:hypothetical protein
MLEFARFHFLLLGINLKGRLVLDDMLKGPVPIGKELVMLKIKQLWIIFKYGVLKVPREMNRYDPLR